MHSTLAPDENDKLTIVWGCISISYLILLCEGYLYCSPHEQDLLHHLITPYSQEQHHLFWYFLGAITLSAGLP